jgi:hypothetical protein
MNQVMLVKGAARVDELVVGQPIVQSQTTAEEVFREHWKPMLRLATVLVGSL